MGWWPFGRSIKRPFDDPHMRGTTVWLQDLRETCERCFDNHAEGQRMIRQLQVEWTSAHGKLEIDDELLQGLDRRAFRLLRADGKEWLKWLDDEDFWKPGWRGDGDVSEG
jgi:hypothetical protein